MKIQTPFSSLPIASVAPVIDILPHARTLDFSSGIVEPTVFHALDRREAGAYAIGRYLEDRPDMYTTEQYAALASSGKSARTVHMGMDFFAPPGTPVRSFWEGRVHDFRYRSDALDYGYTVIIEYDLPDQLKLYALYGHLGAASLEGPGVGPGVGQGVGKTKGQVVAAGEVIGVVGTVEENGGWEIPHLHFQLSYVPPVDCDYPGVVAREDVAWARLRFPDPAWVLL